MSTDSFDYLLDQGWEIVGYATDMMAMGAMTHSVLLRKSRNLRSIVVLIQNGREVSRVSVNL